MDQGWMSNDRYRNVYQDDCSHFCTASVIDCIPALLGERICHLLLGSWRKQRKRYAVRIEGFVIMPDHVHLLVRGSAEGVRKFMQYSLAETSRGIQAALESVARSGDALAGSHLRVFRSAANGPSLGKVWKERFRALPVDRECDLLVKLEYIHNNPVRRGLAEAPSDWPWSSYGAYHGSMSVLAVELVELVVSA